MNQREGYERLLAGTTSDGAHISIKVDDKVDKECDKISKKLPRKAQLSVLSFLYAKDHGACASVSKEWKNLWDQSWNDMLKPEFRQKTPKLAKDWYRLEPAARIIKAESPDILDRHTKKWITRRYRCSGVERMKFFCQGLSVVGLCIWKPITRWGSDHKKWQAAGVCAAVTIATGLATAMSLTLK